MATSAWPRTGQNNRNTGRIPVGDESLIAYYPFNSNANDESGNDRNGTVTGATLTTDRHGNANAAYYFDGNDNIKTTVYPDSDSFSASGWFYLNSINGSDQFLFMDGDSGGDKDVYAAINSEGKLQFETKDDHELRTSPLSAGQWHHFVCIADAAKDTKTIWIDGVKSAEATSWTGTANNGTHYNMTFGAAADGALINRFFTGKLDDIRIYNRALK